MKRERAGREEIDSTSQSKKQKSTQLTRTEHAVLSNYYGQLFTLRDYLIHTIKLNGCRPGLLERLQNRDQDDFTNGGLETLLDRVLVAYDHNDKSHHPPNQELLVNFVQATNSCIGQDIEPDEDLQSAIVNFVIYELFKSSSKSRIDHLLCQGLERNADHANISSGIPGVSIRFPNSHIETLISRDWCQVLQLLGKRGEYIMIPLLRDCAIYMPTTRDPVNNDNYYQLTGIPLAFTMKSTRYQEKRIVRFTRNKMYYSRPAFNRNGSVKLGLKHVHVLNRFDNIECRNETKQILEYVFPRQFGLRSVFTCTIDEIKSLHNPRSRDQESKSKVQSDKIPRRLRGQLFDLIQNMRKTHKRLAYKELLNFYCHKNKSESNDNGIKIQTHYASRITSVVAFIQSIIRKLISKSNWGACIDGNHNVKVIENAISDIIQRRKFETLTLHEIVDAMKITCIPWLKPPNCKGKTSKSDFLKRKEILSEFIYFIFDSLVIPLIRCNFHVTESNHDKNEVFFFRLDVWHDITQPAIHNLKSNMFEVIPKNQVAQFLTRKQFCHSYMRLLPKSESFRPIMNLSRRPESIQYGRKYLGKSINDVLKPVHKAMQYEANISPSILGHSLFSVGSIHHILGNYKSSLLCLYESLPKLYFAKVDIQACFDNLPQCKSLSIVEELLDSDEYYIGRHAVISPPEKVVNHVKNRVKYGTEAYSEKAIINVEDSAMEKLDGKGRRNNIYNGVIGQNVFRKRHLVHLLTEHIRSNVVKIRKKFYRQKKGIPQGGIVSPLLCSLVYAELENNHLEFLSQHQESILVRMIDDFLCISTDISMVKNFVRIMHQGVQEYGVNVKHEKTMTNFPMNIDNVWLRTLNNGEGLPYCGISIDTKNLNVFKDMTTVSKSNILKSLTIENASRPGQAFRQKSTSRWAMHLHAMFYDTSHNSVITSLINVYRTFEHRALWMVVYMNNLRNHVRLNFSFIFKTIEDMIGSTYKSIVRRLNGKWKVSRQQTEWLAYRAFFDIVCAQQTGKQRLVRWLEWNILRTWPTRNGEAKALQKALKMLASKVVGEQDLGRGKSGVGST